MTRGALYHQPTVLAFMQAGSTVGIQQAFTSSNHPQGNAETAPVMRTLNAACLWRQEWTSPLALIRALEGRNADDNEHSLHSAREYQSPRQFERHYELSHGTPFVAA